MNQSLAYCGSPPDPGELLSRFNLDPWLLFGLGAALVLHLLLLGREVRARQLAAAGWAVATTAFVSPLCALSVSLFAARVGQHMLLILVAAPLIAAALPVPVRGKALWPATLLFFGALWFWHMPVPYDATFRSAALYWAMHLTLFGSAILLWAALLHSGRDHAGMAIAAGAVSSLQMGFLGAFLTLAGHPFFVPHLATTAAWGLTPLQDQQLGGVLMWVPSIFLFLGMMLHAARAGWARLEGEAA